MQDTQTPKKHYNSLEKKMLQQHTKGTIVNRLELAEKLGLPASTVRDLAIRGIIPCHKGVTGKRLYFILEEVTAAWDEKKRQLLEELNK